METICKKCREPGRKMATVYWCNRCHWLYRQENSVNCNTCGKFRMLGFLSEDGSKHCGECLNNIIGRKDHPCSVCREIRWIYKKTEEKRAICSGCATTNKSICSKCNKIERVAQREEDGSPVCVRCYSTPLEECSICSKVNPVYVRNDGEPICIGCYELPQEACFECSRVRKVAVRTEVGQPLCDTCHKAICAECNEYRRVALSEGPICRTCREKWRIQNDPILHLKETIRCAIKDKFSAQNKKSKRTAEYGIDIEKIIEHLGPCPGDRVDYHVDHIFPVSAFDLSKEAHIRAAFAPENHQWLLKEENMKKGAKYNEEKLKMYLEKFTNE